MLPLPFLTVPPYATVNFIQLEERDLLLIRVLPYGNVFLIFIFYKFISLS